MKNNSIAFVVGLLFSIGLGISGMTKPSYVKGFLDIFGDWNFTLLFVMIGAILTHGIFYRAIKKRSRPFFDVKFHLPTKNDIDQRLLLGALIFGIGWGIGGFCPGPALVSLASGSEHAIVFVVSMILGMYGFRFFAKIFKLN